MPATKQTTSAALLAMSSVVITSFVVAALYFGREVLIPIALAVLLTFLLTPIVTRLERWIGRVAAVMVAVAVLFGVVGGVGWVLTTQVLDLATQLPDYKENIQAKLRSLKKPTGRFDKLSATVEELKKDLPGAGTPAPPEGQDPPEAKDDGQPRTEINVTVPQHRLGGGLPEPAASSEPPKPVEVVESKHAGPIERMMVVLSPVLGPLGTGALVLLLLIFMLMQREDLRGRLIRLIGKGNISATTRAMDDAAQRVSRYLLMQLIVNATYGLAIGTGLYFIGVPSAFTWGVLATVLRFIPYVGPWIAAAFPIALSLAVTKDWQMPLYTVGLFVVIELLSNNVMEPLLYGSSTGVSSVALIIAAVFWTWLWGAAGLVLATPLTVCMVVMGRHIPRLAFLSVLLSDEEALAPYEEFYHRLLTPDQNDAGQYAENYLKENSQTALYDSVFVPVVIALERDCRADQLDQDQHDSIQLEMREIIDLLETRPPTPAAAEPPEEVLADAEEKMPSDAPIPTCRVLVLPVRADRDELPGVMLSQLLRQQGYDAQSASAKLVTGELLQLVEEEGAEAICISVVPPSTIIQARYLSGKVRARFPKAKIIVGLWGATEQLAEATQSLRTSGADEVVTTLADAIVQISKHAAVLAQEAVLVGPSPDEAERLAALDDLQFTDREPNLALDRITAKLARILNMPIALVSFVGKERQVFASECGLPAELAEAGGVARDLSVCSQVVATHQPLVVEDLARDRRFSANPLLREKGLRFYAGVPLRSTNGHTLGSLCVLDYQPRKFSDQDLRLLQVSAEEVMDIVNSRAPAVAAASVAA